MKIYGNVTFNLAGEERAFWIKTFKQIKADSELEKRILKRTLMKLLGQMTHRFPLYPPRECPVCERTFQHRVYDRHVFICKRRNRIEKFDIDPEIIRRIEME